MDMKRKENTKAKTVNKKQKQLASVKIIKKVNEIVKGPKNSFLISDSFSECGKIKKILHTDHFKDTFFVLVDNILKIYGRYNSPEVFDQTTQNILNSLDEFSRFPNYTDGIKMDLIDMCFKIEEDRIDLILYSEDGFIKVINTKCNSVQQTLQIEIGEKRIFYHRGERLLLTLDVNNKLSCWDLEEQSLVKAMDFGDSVLHFFCEQDLLVVQSKNGVFSRVSLNIRKKEIPTFEIIFSFDDLAEQVGEKNVAADLKQIHFLEEKFFLLFDDGCFFTLDLLGKLLNFMRVDKANCFHVSSPSLDLKKLFVIFGLNSGISQCYEQVDVNVADDDEQQQIDFSLCGQVKIIRQSKPVDFIYFMKQAEMFFFVQDGVEKSGEKKSKIFILKESLLEEVELMDK